MTASFNIWFPENNKISQVKDNHMVFDCLEVSQGPDRIVDDQKGILVLATASFLVIWLHAVFLFVNCQLWVSFDGK